jgi:hypothetical protein
MRVNALLLRAQNHDSNDKIINYLQSRERIYTRIITDAEECNTFLENGFKGFLVFQMDPPALSHWFSRCRHNFNNFYKLYYNSNLYIHGLYNSIMMDFDFVIVDNSTNIKTLKIIDFLESNFWRKIPARLISDNGNHLNPLVKKIIKIIELSDIHTLTLECVASRLNLNSNIIRHTLRRQCNKSFTELKDTLTTYYKSNFPMEAD